MIKIFVTIDNEIKSHYLNLVFSKRVY